MKYSLIILFVTAVFFAQAENSGGLGGFVSVNVGAAVNSKLTDFNYPVSFSYGGNILEDRYVGVFEVGAGTYRGWDEFQVPIHLLFKYSYDFMVSSSNWGIGLDTTLYLGGATINYGIDQEGKIIEGDDWANRLTESKKGIELYIGHALGLFVRKRIIDIQSQSLIVLLRLGINNALVMRPRFSKKDKDKEETMKIKNDWLTPNFYLGTGFRWYF